MGRRAKMKRIGRMQAKVIRELVEKAAADALRSSGLEVEIDGTVKFDEATCTVKVKAFLADERDSVNEDDSKLLGFDRNIVGESFLSRTTVFTITGINMNRPKYPISASNARGTAYKFKVEQVARTMLNSSITHSRGF